MSTRVLKKIFEFISVDCNLVLNCCLEKCFSRLFSELESVIQDRCQMYSEAPKVPLVGLLPSLARTLHLFLKPPEALPVIQVRVQYVSLSILLHVSLTLCSARSNH